MRVINPGEMARIEKLSYKDGFSDAEFMEEAGRGISLGIQNYIEKNSLSKRIILVCGKGNNAGDAYVCGKYLLESDYEVIALQTFPIESCSALCQKNFYTFKEKGGVVKFIQNIDELALPTDGVIIDGLFGTGFKGKVEEPFSSLIFLLNHSHLPIFSIDIPSGLNGETGVVEEDAIIAKKTFFLGLPKTGFFINEGWNHTGVLEEVDFGLPQTYIEQSKTSMVMMTSEFLKFFLPPIKRNRHKYERGYVLGISGSLEMPGAALLSSWSSLAGGAGITRLLYPRGIETQLSNAKYEIIKTPFDLDKLDSLKDYLEKCDSVYIGPGLGRNDEMQGFIKRIFTYIDKPCVIDADALFCLSQNDQMIPKNSILTPHKGEMERLLKIDPVKSIDQSFLQKCQEYAEKRNVTIVLKGGPSFIFHPDEPILVCPRGTPGMATAGSGDVLTGLIAAQLAQGIAPSHACAVSVYIHGVAGEYAERKKTAHCMLASDIVYHFPDAFKELAMET